MTRPRVFVVATWLPTQKNPGLGSFCERDIQALSTVADIRVLHVVASHVDDGVRHTWIQAEERRIPVLRLPLRRKSVPDMLRIVQAIQAGGRWADVIHSMAVSALLPVALARLPLTFCSRWSSQMAKTWRESREPRQTARGHHTWDQARRSAGTLPWIHTEHWSGFMGETPTARVMGRLESLPNRVVAVSGILAERVKQFSGRSVDVVGNIVQVPPATPRRDIAQILALSWPGKNTRQDLNTSVPSPHGCAWKSNLQHPHPNTLSNNADLTRPASWEELESRAVQAQPVLHLIGVGGLIPHKRPLLALQVTAALRSHGVNAQLTWVGGGELADQMRMEAQQTSVPLTLTGVVPPEQVSHYLARADMLILPTIGETFCLAAAEALASGRPVVVGARGGQADFVHPPVGRLVDSDDPDVWADAVVQTLKESAQMSAESIAADVRSRFSAQNLACAYQRLYKQLTAPQDAPSGGLQHATRRPASSGQRPIMVFHAPFSLDKRATSASGIRPVQMRQAFIDAGFEVIDVSGSATQRRRSIRDLACLLRSGLSVSFAYSESATLPTTLSGRPGHWPIPVGDLALYALLRYYRVPTGVFYRDIYWRFPDYRRSTGVLALGTIPLYVLDLVVYRLCRMCVFVPSLEMAQYVPFVRWHQFESLPPGTSNAPSGGLQHSTRVSEQDLRGSSQPRLAVHLLYVGGLGTHYGMHRLVQAVAETSGISLTICTRNETWTQVASQYQQWVADTRGASSGAVLSSGVGRIHVVHESGAGLEPLYQQANVASLVVEPEQYRSFAMPFKLFEYLGHGLPVLATKGTMAGDFVQHHHVGWTVDYDQDQIKALLQHLATNPEKIQEAAIQVRTVAEQNTWVSRARQAVSVLTQAPTPGRKARS